jgi:hypothetical protein
MDVDMKKPNSIQKNEKGMAMIEALPLIIVFVMMLSFGLGFFGVIQTAILHSISARAYAFETFRGRANLNYFREDGSALDASKGPLYLGTKGFRYHAIQHEVDGRALFVATTRNIAMGTVEPKDSGLSQTHNIDIYQILERGRNTKTNVNPAWIMVGYGICLNSSCGNQ